MRSYQSSPAMGPGGDAVIGFVIGHQHRVIDDVGIGLVRPAASSSKGAAWAMIQPCGAKACRHFRQEGFQILVIGGLHILRNRSSRPAACWRRGKRTILPSSAAAPRRVCQQAAQFRAIPVAGRGVLQHRQDGDIGFAGCGYSSASGGIRLALKARSGPSSVSQLGITQSSRGRLRLSEEKLASAEPPQLT